MNIRIFQKGFNYSQDGPGNRLVYHLQGCNLRCPWCSNPEGLVLYGGHIYNVDDLVREVFSCRPMFFDGGGVTLTGGEVLIQFEAVRKLLSELRENDINTAIETNGIHPHLPELFPFLSHLIIDCKHYNSEKHRAATGLPNDLTVRNLILAIEKGKHPAVRIPMIGGFNASMDDARGFAKLFREIGLPGNGTLELLRYHEFGKDKYKKCGMEYTMTNEAKISEDMFSKFSEILRQSGIELIQT